MLFLREKAAQVQIVAGPAVVGGGYKPIVALLIMLHEEL